MNKEFNKKLLLENISYLVKEKNLKIGEVETQAGVSPGYISRNRDGNTKPGIDFIVRIADILGVSIDTLLMIDLSKLTPTENYLVKFIDKLIRDTSSDKLEWNCETEKSLNALETDNNGFVSHPLFQSSSVTIHNGEEYPESYVQAIFVSRSYENSTYIGGNCYNLSLKNQTTLFLMNVQSSDDREDVASAIEIWMYSNQTGRKFVCSTYVNYGISYLIETLYYAVVEDSKHPKLNKDIKSTIDAFMNDDLSDETPYGPFIVDDDVPF